MIIRFAIKVIISTAIVCTLCIALFVLMISSISGKLDQKIVSNPRVYLGEYFAEIQEFADYLSVQIRNSFPDGLLMRIQSYGRMQRLYPSDSFRYEMSNYRRYGTVKGKTIQKYLENRRNFINIDDVTAEYITSENLPSLSYWFGYRYKFISHNLNNILIALNFQGSGIFSDRSMFFFESQGKEGLYKEVAQFRTALSHNQGSNFFGNGFYVPEISLADGDAPNKVFMTIGEAASFYSLKDKSFKIYEQLGPFAQIFQRYYVYLGREGQIKFQDILNHKAFSFAGNFASVKDLYVGWFNHRAYVFILTSSRMDVYKVSIEDEKLKKVVSVGLNSLNLLANKGIYFANFNPNMNSALPIGIGLVSRYNLKNDYPVGTLVYLNLESILSEDRFREVDGSDIAYLRINGHLDYSYGITERVDGIGSSAPRNVGYIDSDDLPDLVVGSHWGMANSGALYILPGKHIRRLKRNGLTEIDVSHESIIRVLGPEAGELSAPHTIQIGESTKGCADVFVSADNDERVMPRNGGIYRLNFCLNS